MDAGIRRQEILDRLAATRRPLAATRLGAQLGVSRQVIVGDVALLRAEGHPIRATNRGYVLARPAPRPHRHTNRPRRTTAPAHHASPQRPSAAGTPARVP